jgi:hypothetical protein
MGDATLGAYLAMTPNARKQVLLAEYRCAIKRCLLMHIWQTPHGRCFYLPPYRLSPDMTETRTVESARLKRTEDGYRLWRARAGSLDELVEFFQWNPGRGGLPVNCGHVRATVPVEQVVAAVAAAAARPTGQNLPRRVVGCRWLPRWLPRDAV